MNSSNSKKLNPTFGILGMKERAKAIGGNLEIVSNSNNGTTISVHLPILKKDLQYD